jgi:hypothetical protein
MVTLTYAHGSVPLADKQDALDRIVGRFTKRGDWSRFQKQWGVTGYAVAREITHNMTGWHSHVHLVLTFTAQPSPAALQCLQDALTRRWCAAAAWAGHDASESVQSYSWMRPGFDADDMAEYVTKQSLLHRAPEAKRGRYPADLLAGAVDGDDDDLDLYREYLDAARGRGLVRAYGALSQHRAPELDFDQLLAAGAL